MDDTLIDDLRMIRLSITPGSRMFTSQVPPLRKQIRILREVEKEITKFRKLTAAKPNVKAKRAWYE